MNGATCRSCGAPIIWLQTPKGKWMPADEGLVPYKENPEGKERIVTDRGEVIPCDLTFDGWPTGMARIPHWATCPNAAKHKKGATP